MQQTLEVQSVSKLYGAGDNIFKALNEVSLRIEEGEFVGVMGSSGSGKTTLLNAISTIDTSFEGSIFMSNQDISRLTEKELASFRRNTLGFIFQDYNLLNTLTLRENIALGLTIKKVPRAKIGEIVEESAARLGIAEILDRYPYDVSGGQRQRCACARALASKPGLILADEPTGALDSKSAQTLMETLVQMNQETGITILMVTHDAFSASYCKRILFMKDGEIAQELIKTGDDNKKFLAEILDMLAGMTGGDLSVS